MALLTEKYPFIFGMGKAIDIWGISFRFPYRVYSYRYGDVFQDEDSAAIMEDWSLVGDDIREACGEFKQANSDLHSI